jgi:uncharacterized protein with HEPN domain
MKRDYRLYIEDILDSVVKIQQFTSGMKYEEFVKDEKTNTAVIHKLEIMGEATKNVPREVKVRYKNVPWNDMARMRDKLSHGYFGIRYEIVWKVIQEKLPEIKPIMENILKEIRD